MDEQPWEARLARLNRRLEGTEIPIEVGSGAGAAYRTRLRVESVAVRPTMPGAGEDGRAIVVTGTPEAGADEESPRGRGRFAFSALLNPVRLIRGNLSALERSLARGQAVPVQQLPGVTCPHCGHDREGRFCPACGTRLRFTRPAACTETHHDTGRGSRRFCPDCGAWLSPRPGSGKERLRGLGGGDFGGARDPG